MNNPTIDGVSRELSIPIKITAQHAEDLLRFFDTCEDDQGYDVPKPRMKSLARVGLIRSTGFSRYEITDLGYAAVENLCEPADAPAVERQELKPVVRVCGAGYDAERNTVWMETGVVEMPIMRKVEVGEELVFISEAQSTIARLEARIAELESKN